MEGKVIEISSSGEVGLWVGTTRIVVGVAVAVFALAVAFFLACLEAAVDLSLGFLGVVVSLVVTIRSRAPP